MTNLLFTPPALGTALSLTGLPGGGNKLHDRSPCGNNGTITGATWKRLPSGLWHLSYDGTDDHTVVSHAPSLNTGGKLTVRVWARKGVASFTGYIVEKRGTAGIELYYHSSDNRLRLLVNTTVVVWLTAITDLKWHHIVGTYDKDAGAQNARLYFDGVQVVSGTVTGVEDNTENLSIGAENAAVNRFNGDIALLEIIRRPWTALEVQNSFNQEKYLFGVW